MSQPILNGRRIKPTFITATQQEALWAKRQLALRARSARLVATLDRGDHATWVGRTQFSGQKPGRNPPGT